MMGSGMMKNDAGLILGAMVGMTSSIDPALFREQRKIKVWSWEHDKKPLGCDAAHKAKAKNRKRKKQARKKKRGF